MKLISHNRDDRNVTFAADQSDFRIMSDISSAARPLLKNKDSRRGVWLRRELLRNEVIIHVISSSILIELECFDRIPDWIPDSQRDARRLLNRDGGSSSLVL